MPTTGAPGSLTLNRDKNVNILNKSKNKKEKEDLNRNSLSRGVKAAIIINENDWSGDGG